MRAGKELAVAATKTYTATLLGLYLLVDAIRGGDGARGGRLGALAQSTLDACGPGADEAAQRYRFVERMVTTGRGYSLASALEAALKLAETSYLAARAYSGADLLHGPVAALDSDTGVVAVTSTGKGGEAMVDVLQRRARTWRGRARGRLGRRVGVRPRAGWWCRRRPRKWRRSWKSCRSSAWPWRCPWPGAATRTSPAA